LIAQYNSTDNININVNISHPPDQHQCSDEDNGDWGLIPRFLNPMDAIPVSNYVAYVSILEESKIVPISRYFG